MTRARFYSTKVRPTSPAWVDSHDELLAVAEYGIELGELVTAVDVLRFFEKPWHWEELRGLYLADRENQAEQQWLDRYADNV